MDIPEGVPGPIRGQIRRLIGCAWGYDIVAPADMEPCTEDADQIVILHDGDRQVPVKLCAKHIALVNEMTDEHKEQPDGS